MKLNRLTALVHALIKLTAALIGLLKLIIKLVDMASNYQHNRVNINEEISLVT